MNIVNKLTFRQLRKNKKRTLVTIIGVIISVAMITAVAALGLSFMDMMRRQTIADDGEWHVLYENLNREQLEAVRAADNTETVLLSRDLGYAVLEGGKNRSKPYLFVKEYDGKGIKGFPFHVIEGRLPQSPDEIAVPEHVASNGKVEYHLGDVLELDIGERYNSLEPEGPGLGQEVSLGTDENGDSFERLRNTKHRRFTVVGLIERPKWERTWSPGYTLVTFNDGSGISDEERFNASVVAKKVSRDLFGEAQQLAEANGINKVVFNNTLLRTYGVVRSDGMQGMLNTLTAIIMVIIMVGSVSLIYNAFAISVSERSRHLGMLSSVGATKKQKRNSVFFEGAVIGAVSIPIGILCGLLGIGITFVCVNPLIQGAFGVTEGLRLAISPAMLAGAALLSAVTIFISTYIPARRASRITPIDAIRQTEDVKLTGRTVKTSRLTRLMFGIEAELGLKNLKRNKRRYKATVFSLIISLVLFLSVSYFSINLTKAFSLTQDGYNFDIQVSGGEDLYDQLVNLDGVTKGSSIQRLHGGATLKGDKLPDDLRQSPEYRAAEDAFPYTVMFCAPDDASLREYAQAVGVDYDRLVNGEELFGIVIDQLQYRDSEQEKYVDRKLVHLAKGDRLPMEYYDPDNKPYTVLGEVVVLQTTDQYPMGVMSMGDKAGFQVIVSRNTIQQLAAKLERAQEELTAGETVYLRGDDPVKLQTAIEELRDASDTDCFDIFNVYQMHQEEEQLMMLLTVFVYGFIILITAICVANIFNTISTSISLRKREFAMIKSVGMTPKGFNKMIYYESIFYGIKALFYGLPVSLLVMLLIYVTLTRELSFGFMLPWTQLAVAVAAVFLIVGAAMMYSSSKVKRENIIDALKQENI